MTFLTLEEAFKLDPEKGFGGISPLKKGSRNVTQLELGEKPYLERDSPPP